MLIPDIIRSVVYIVFFLETVQTALSGADLYYWFAIGFGKTDHLFSSFLSFLDVPIMGFVVALIVQFFFVYRILVLSERRWWWLCVIIGLVSSFPKSRNDLAILRVALHFRCTWGVRDRCCCESPPFHIAHAPQLQQSYIIGVFIRGVLALQTDEIVKSSKDSMDYLSN
jgi:hypothetical protein